MRDDATRDGRDDAIADGGGRAAMAPRALDAAAETRHLSIRNGRRARPASPTPDEQ